MLNRLLIEAIIIIIINIIIVFSLLSKTYVADLILMYCLNIVRCMIVYLNCFIIMRFKEKLLLSLLWRYIYHI